MLRAHLLSRFGCARPHTMVSMMQFSGLFVSTVVVLNSFDSVMVRLHDRRVEADEEQMRALAAKKVYM
jgi:hypothetical protein